MKPAPASPPPNQPATELAWGRSDWLLLAGLLIFGFFWLRTTPEFAANLPQDAADNCIPAVTFLERGHLGTIIFGQLQPTGRTIGVPLLLIPVYAVFGHFIGNGIYMILVFALGTVALVYLIGREIGRRLAGTLAAIFLLAHHGFRLYSQKIMSEVPNLFFVTLVLALVLMAHRRPQRLWLSLLLGIALGWAVIVRSENTLLVLPLGALWLTGLLKAHWKHILVIAACAAPMLVLQLAYNHSYYGSVWRNAYQWIGWFQEPSFALHNATARGYWTTTRHYPPEFANRMDGNLVHVIKTMLSQADHSLPFSHPSIWTGRPRALYQTLLVLRFAFCVAGVVWCFYWWRQRTEVKTFAICFLIIAATTAVFYTFFSWQEERYLMRVISLMCILNGLGVVAVIELVRQRWPALDTPLTVSVAGLVGGLVALLAFISRSGLAYAGDDNLNLYRAMTTAASQMESNAVVVSNWDPWRIDILITRGTDRQLIPTAKDRDIIRYPASHPNGISLAPFTAAESPEKLADLMMRQGRSAYLLLRDPFDFRPPPPEVQVLSEHWDLHPLLSFSTPQGQLIGHYLYRLQPKLTIKP